MDALDSVIHWRFAGRPQVSASLMQELAFLCSWREGMVLVRCGGVALDPLVLVVMGWSCLTRCGASTRWLCARGAARARRVWALRLVRVANAGSRVAGCALLSPWLLANWQIYGVAIPKGLVASRPVVARGTTRRWIDIRVFLKT